MVDEQNHKNGYRVVEWFRFVTPALLSITLFMVGNLTSQLNDIDNKIFKHLTNDEIHIPRGQIVGKSEFTIYSKFADERNERIFVCLEKINEELKELNKK